jgi:L-lysine exporter family protein LysE/ArgO
MLRQLLKGIALGIGAVAPIGPVNVEIIRRTLKHGWRAGFALGLGAVTVDVTYALLTSLGVAQLSGHPGFYRAIQILGAMLLTYLAVMSLIEAFRAARSSSVGAIDDAPSPPMHHGYFTGLAMTFLNPMTILFWFTAVPAATGAAQSRGELPIICLGVFVAAIAWVLFFTTALKSLRRWRRQWWMMAADALGGLLLLAFAGYAFWTSILRFL